MKGLLRPRLSEEEYKLILDKRAAEGKRTFVEQSNLNYRPKEPKQKRLFIDIETGYYILKVRTWSLKNFEKYFDHKNIIKEKEILVVSWKWEGEDVVYRSDFRNGEKPMLEEVVKAMNEATEIVAHNGAKFDEPFIRTRCLFHRIPMLPRYKILDTLTKSRSHFLFASNKLDYLSRFVGGDGKLEHEGFPMWEKVVENNDMEALDKMGEYCDIDVIELEDYFHVIRPYILGVSNFATYHGGERWHCPECGSVHTKLVNTLTTPMGTIQRMMECSSCNVNYKISNKSYHDFLNKEINGKTIQ